MKGLLKCIQKQSRINKISRYLKKEFRAFKMQPAVVSQRPSLLKVIFSISITPPKKRSSKSQRNSVKRHMSRWLSDKFLDGLLTKAGLGRERSERILGSENFRG